MWRIGILIVLIVSAGVLSVEIGRRLSDEVVMTVVGVFCGILASIPVSIGLLMALTRERHPYADDPEPEQAPTAGSYYQVLTPDPPRLSPTASPQSIVIVVPRGTTLQQLDHDLPGGLPPGAKIKYVEPPIRETKYIEQPK